jgi:hypothetical protein
MGRPVRVLSATEFLVIRPPPELFQIIARVLALRPPPASSKAAENFFLQLAGVPLAGALTGTMVLLSIAQIRDQSRAPCGCGVALWDR